jgi:two-component system response regulator NreC
MVVGENDPNERVGCGRAVYFLTSGCSVGLTHRGHRIRLELEESRKAIHPRQCRQPRRAAPVRRGSRVKKASRALPQQLDVFPRTPTRLPARSVLCMTALPLRVPSSLTPAVALGNSPRPVPIPITVVLADDHTLMRRTLRLLLDGELGVEVIAEAADLTGAIRHVQARLPQVLVLDLGISGPSGLEEIEALRRLVPETQIVAVSMEDNAAFAQRALAVGALAFVVKDLADIELPDAVRAAARGARYVSPRVAARLASLDQSLSEERLTAREREVLGLIVRGHTSAEAARLMDLSPRTVETHRAHIHEKLGLTTRAQLVSYALGRGLLTA